jgi:hypothetical protein
VLSRHSKGSISDTPARVSDTPALVSDTPALVSDTLAGGAAAAGAAEGSEGGGALRPRRGTSRASKTETRDLSGGARVGL